MNKAELMKLISQRTGLTLDKTKDCIDSYAEIIGMAMKDGEKVIIANWGTYEAKKRAERKGVNPRTGEEMIIPATIAPTLTFAPSFKDDLNK